MWDLTLPTFFYPTVYSGVENDTKTFIALQKANNAEFTKFYKYQFKSAMFLCYWRKHRVHGIVILQLSNIYDYL